jgi:hypothetical protein
MARLERDVQRLFELLEEVIEAVQEEEIPKRQRKLETVREKVRRERGRG